MKARLQRLRRWLAYRRRRVLALLLLIAFFYALGYFTPRVSSPLMCKIYG